MELKQLTRESNELEQHAAKLRGGIQRLGLSHSDGKGLNSSPSLAVLQVVDVQSSSIHPSSPVAVANDGSEHIPRFSKWNGQGEEGLTGQTNNPSQEDGHARQEEEQEQHEARVGEGGKMGSLHAELCAAELRAASCKASVETTRRLLHAHFANEQTLAGDVEGCWRGAGGVNGTPTWGGESGAAGAADHLFLVQNEQSEALAQEMERLSHDMGRLRILCLEMDKACSMSMMPVEPPLAGPGPVWPSRLDAPGIDQALRAAAGPVSRTGSGIRPSPAGDANSGAFVMDAAVTATAQKGIQGNAEETMPVEQTTAEVSISTKRPNQDGRTDNQKTAGIIVNEEQAYHHQQQWPPSKPHPPPGNGRLLRCEENLALREGGLQRSLPSRVGANGASDRSGTGESLQQVGRSTGFSRGDGKAVGGGVEKVSLRWGASSSRDSNTNNRWKSIVWDRRDTLRKLEQLKKIVAFLQRRQRELEERAGACLAHVDGPEEEKGRSPVFQQQQAEQQFSTPLNRMDGALPATAVSNNQLLAFTVRADERERESNAGEDESGEGTPTPIMPSPVLFCTQCGAYCNASRISYSPVYDDDRLRSQSEDEAEHRRRQQKRLHPLGKRPKQWKSQVEEEEGDGGEGNEEEWEEEGEGEDRDTANGERKTIVKNAAYCAAVQSCEEGQRQQQQEEQQQEEQQREGEEKYVVKRLVFASSPAVSPNEKWDEHSVLQEKIGDDSGKTTKQFDTSHQATLWGSRGPSRDPPAERKPTKRRTRKSDEEEEEDGKERVRSVDSDTQTPLPPYSREIAVQVFKGVWRDQSPTVAGGEPLASSGDGPVVGDHHVAAGLDAGDDTLAADAESLEDELEQYTVSIQELVKLLREEQNALEESRRREDEAVTRICTLEAELDRASREIRDLKDLTERMKAEQDSVCLSTSMEAECATVAAWDGGAGVEIVDGDQLQLGSLSERMDMDESSSVAQEVLQNRVQDEGARAEALSEELAAERERCSLAESETALLRSRAEELATAILEYEMRKRESEQEGSPVLASGADDVLSHSGSAIRQQIAALQISLRTELTARHLAEAKVGELEREVSAQAVRLEELKQHAKTLALSLKKGQKLGQQADDPEVSHLEANLEGEELNGEEDLLRSDETTDEEHLLRRRAEEMVEGLATELGLLSSAMRQLTSKSQWKVSQAVNEREEQVRMEVLLQLLRQELKPQGAGQEGGGGDGSQMPDETAGEGKALQSQEEGHCQEQQLQGLEQSDALITNKPHISHGETMPNTEEGQQKTANGVVVSAVEEKDVDESRDERLEECNSHPKVAPDLKSMCAANEVSQIDGGRGHPSLGRKAHSEKGRARSWEGITVEQVGQDVAEVRWDGKEEDAVEKGKFLSLCLEKALKGQSMAQQRVKEMEQRVRDLEASLSAALKMKSADVPGSRYRRRLWQQGIHAVMQGVLVCYALSDFMSSSVFTTKAIPFPT
ncbi:hypothetical protein CBR_g18870 [Chara braunii]|uniref:Uncharacterized protein n=1 Tax=Chara braunii TaxID=69332 RepID=A0A388KWL5_CHABU|nr:hypothetical protein CBR_g18870 [Chara braunii]|eukprot:GBG74460.1 hypothetical protein CBR_g18870 [Chara braunii]